MKWGAAILLTFGLMACTAASASADLLTNLVGYWSFDETSGTFADLSGSGNPATAVGSPHGNGSNGLIGGALDLDGAND